MSTGPVFDLLGFEICDTTLEELVDYCVAGSSRDVCSTGIRTVVFANTHLLSTARQDPEFGRIIRSTNLIMPDGMPVVWAGRLKRARLKRRVDGPGFMELTLRMTQNGSVGHYFLGGKPEVLDRMLSTVVSKYPGVRVVGAESPPFRDLTTDENDAIIHRINTSGAHMIWVGLGCPKQERWMNDNKGRLRAVFAFGVGQAFDILAGTVDRAPLWMQNIGLEWLYRLTLEPKRLWKRYLVAAPLFLGLFLLDELKRTCVKLFSRINLFWSYLRLRTGLYGPEPKIVIGAATTIQPGWIATDRFFLDLLKESDWSRYFRPDSIGGIVAEHVWEHLSLADGLRAAKMCFGYLVPGGRLRVAVPDGFFPDPDYLERVRPGGSGSSAHAHKMLYDYKSLRDLFESAGYRVTLLEYWDESGAFHSYPIQDEHGAIRRCSKRDPRNQGVSLRYTSLVLDAFKICC